MTESRIGGSVFNNVINDFQIKQIRLSSLGFVFKHVHLIDQIYNQNTSTRMIRSKKTPKT